MINLDEINGEIAKMEEKPLTYVTAERLSWLYIVRDHITLTGTAEKTMPEGDTAFCKACAGKPVSSVMGIMDELMETLQVMQPRLYDAVMQKLH